MPKPVVLVGALDTKGEEFRFVRDLIQTRGLDTLVVDFGVVGDPPFVPDISADEVARAGGSSLADLRADADKARAMQVMADGLTQVVVGLHREGRLGGILGMAGGGGTSVATAAMRAPAHRRAQADGLNPGRRRCVGLCRHGRHHHDADRGGRGRPQLDQPGHLCQRRGRDRRHGAAARALPRESDRRQTADHRQHVRRLDPLRRPGARRARRGRATKFSSFTPPARAAEPWNR